MSSKLKDGATANVRLFLQNVSDQDIFLTVSNRGGYDYAVVTNQEGDDIQVERPYIYPTFFSSVLSPEVNPGRTACNPSLATLTKLRLQSGAVYELQTRTSLKYQAKKNASNIRKNGLDRVGSSEDSVETIITSPPGEAWVTWRLHTVNGAEYTKDLKSRTWPAKGGWSGILETARLKITLVSDSPE